MRPLTERRPSIQPILSHTFTASNALSQSLGKGLTDVIELISHKAGFLRDWVFMLRVAKAIVPYCSCEDAGHADHEESKTSLPTQSRPLI